jgi:lipoprotein-releasing system ATP-binding protein
MAEPLLKLTGVRKDYPSGDRARLLVLKGINLEMAEGDSLAVVGPSGSGKSTILNIIGTLDRPDAGSVWFQGKDLAALSEEELARLRNESIGFVFQSHHLLPHCTVLENVLVPTIVARKGRDTAEKRAHRLLERVGLNSRAHHRPGELSGGERQRAAVVRALINQPKLVLADEPTGALDEKSADTLGRLLVELNAEENVTLITVTHSRELAARMRSQKQIRDGTLID